MSRVFDGPVDVPAGTFASLGLSLTSGEPYEGELPGGNWLCTFAVDGDAAIAGAAEHDGPTDAMINLAACVDEDIAVWCAQDESSSPIGPTESIRCSGIFVGATDSFVRVELFQNGEPTDIFHEIVAEQPVRIVG